MNKHVLAALLALPLSAHAAGQEDTHRFYAGIATGQSKSTLENSAGERFTSKSHPLPVKVYGGITLNDHFAVETGFSGTFGEHTFDKRLFGTDTEPRLASHALYLAAKGTVAVSERIDLHAKLGVAHSRFKVSNAGANDRNVSDTKPMFGIGAAYAFTPQVAATLEFEHYGTVRENESKLRRQQVQLGVKVGF